jgi:hypothetical protein
MVLSETLGSMAFFDCPGGHRVPLRLACLSTGLTLPVATSPRNRASQRARRSPPGNGSQRWTDSQPEALKLECAAEHSSFYLLTVDMCSEVP